MADKDSKTEKATPKKRRDERKEGNVFFSKDVISVVSILGCFFLLKLMFPMIYESIGSFMNKYISQAAAVEELDPGLMQAVGRESIETAAKICAPVLIGAAALAVLSVGVQTKFLFTGKKARPKLSNLSPLKGIKNTFSLKNLVELVKSILKVIILIIVLYNIITADLNAAARTMGMSVKASAAYMLDMTMNMIIQISLIFMVIAGFDYLYQRWEYERNIKMSKQELKEEFKQTEGNPEIKGRIRELQRQRARSRMMQAVPEADVIIRNPTHFAVALKYDPKTDNAPVLIAKGQDELALRIVKTGEEHGVEVIENKALARGIYASTPLNKEIPPDYYGVVAEILVQIFKMNHKHNI